MAINFIGAFSSKGKIGKTAKAISNASGGSGLTDYYGGRGSKREAVKSAGRVALTVGSLAAGGALGGAVKGLSKAKTVSKGLKIKRVPTQFFRNDIPGTQGYSAGWVRGKPFNQ
jgi:hypothetical protein